MPQYTCVLIAVETIQEVRTELGNFLLVHVLWRSIDLAQAGITLISEEYVNCHGYFSQQTPSITIYLQNYKGLCHRMKLCISVNWNMTERWLKSDWMAELHPILFSKTKMKHTWFSHFFFLKEGGSFCLIKVFL